jgi:tRNA(Ile2) C34 agmatinyltransferase TiaS
MTEDVVAAMDTWQRAHADATFAEIEAEVARLLAQMHAHVLQTVLAQRVPDTPPPCKHCGQPLEAAGQHTRQIQSRTGAFVTLTRPYYRCPDCGGGIFPPG